MLLARLIATGAQVAVQNPDGECVQLYQGDIYYINIVTEDQEFLRVPRSSISTPVECCPQCATPYEIRKKDDVKCPRHEHHLHELYLTKSNDKGFNRAQRRHFFKLAKQYGAKWKKMFDTELKRLRAKIVKEQGIPEIKVGKQ